MFGSTSSLSGSRDSLCELADNLRGTCGELAWPLAAGERDEGEGFCSKGERSVAFEVAFGEAPPVAGTAKLSS